MLGRGFRPEIGRHGFLRTRPRLQLVRGITKRWAKTMRYRPQDVAQWACFRCRSGAWLAYSSGKGATIPIASPGSLYTPAITRCPLCPIGTKSRASCPV
jgi:hypothetical protein